MTTYLCGTDTYRIKEYLREHAPNASVGEEALKSQGLFDQGPVILYEPSKELKIPEDLEVFVVSEKKPAGKKKNVLEFNPLEGNEVRSWIQGEVKKAGQLITSDVLAILSERYVNTWQSRIELDLLLSYTYGKQGITANDLAAVTSLKIEENIFRFTDALGNKQKKEALLLLARQLASGADPYYLFSMIVFQFRNMLAPDRPGVHPFAAQKARTAAKRFDPILLKRMYRGLFELEVTAKSGLCDMTDGLYRFVFSLS